MEIVKESEALVKNTKIAYLSVCLSVCLSGWFAISVSAESYGWPGSFPVFVLKLRMASISHIIHLLPLQQQLKEQQRRKQHKLL